MTDSDTDSGGDGGRTDGGRARGDKPKRSGSPARKLNRDLIVETALAMIDRTGPEALSMRTLAQELGVEAMSLYRYVHGKEDLLEGVIALLMQELTVRLDEAESRHWQEFLQTAAHEVRRIATDHPKAFPLVATRHPAAPWLRPPLRSIEAVNTFLRSLTGSGLTDAQAVGAYRSFSSFLLGQLLLQAVVQGAATSPTDLPLDEGDATIPQGDGNVSLDVAPEVKRLRGLLSEDHSDEEFEISLEVLLDRLDRELSQ